eukprot:TRINITY_DN1324_c0_g1_i1.p2 TRINITY_DN1324_c0_g1~~TRINITY_DN1324_c0_g1_i1.p2  ORF type:complete len:170 (-),score=10.12 TRINITY_DN1324_c0_g1_i1:1004-1513(-)
MVVVFQYIYAICEQWPDFGCEGIKVQRAHQPTTKFTSSVRKLQKWQSYFSMPSAKQCKEDVNKTATSTARMPASRIKIRKAHKINPKKITKNSKTCYMPKNILSKDNQMMKHSSMMTPLVKIQMCCLNILITHIQNVERGYRLQIKSLLTTPDKNDPTPIPSHFFCFFY